jgi:hypothetical protein
VIRFIDRRLAIVLLAVCLLAILARAVTVIVDKDKDIAPGDTIEKFKLLNDLGAGEYPCTVYVFGIDESTGESFPDQVPLGIEMNITIKS